MAEQEGGDAPEGAYRNGHAAPAPGLPAALSAALRDALAGVALQEEPGEDGLEAFPTEGAEQAMLPAVAPAPPKVPEPHIDEAIRRFHREIGLLPPEEAEEPAAPAAVLPAEPAVEEAPAPPAADDAPAAVLVPAPEPPSPGAADALVPVAAAEVAGGGGMGGGGDGGGVTGGGEGGPGGGPRRRVPFWLAEDQPMTVFEHLDELRARLVRSAIAFAVGLAICFPVTGRILKYTIANAQTYTVRLGGTAHHIQIIGGAPLAALFQFMEFDMILALVVAGPVILWEAVAFVVPALTRGERRALFAYLPASVGLFAAGIAFGLFVFQPVAMRVATTFLAWVQPTYTITEWIGFVIKYSLYFALLYQLPVVVAIAVRLGLVTPELLAKGRRWAFLGALVLALMFAPPADFIVTPSLIVGPLYGLYELSILVARGVQRQRLREEAAR